MKNSLKTLPVLLILLLSLGAFAPTAFAQSGKQGYIQEGPSVIDETSTSPDAGVSDGGGSGTGTNPETGTSPETGTTSSAELPFTGLDLGLLGVAGASLLLMGVGMRHMTRAHDSA